MRPAWSAKQRDFDDIARRPHKFPSFLQKFLTCSSSARNPDRPNPHSSEPSRLLLPADTKTDGEKTICYRNIELIGVIGGLTNSLSSAPQMIDNLRNPDRAYGQNASRNVSVFGQWYVADIRGVDWILGNYHVLFVGKRHGRCPILANGQMQAAGRLDGLECALATEALP